MMAMLSGTALPHRVMGEGQPVILFVHGFLDGGSIWEDVAGELNKAGVTVATVNLPGMGGTPGKPDEISLDSYAGSVASAVDTIGGDLVLVGQSMGAQVAELAAQLRPNAIKGLVLLTPVPLGGVGAPEDVVAPFKSAGGRADAQRQQRIGLSHNLSEEALRALLKLGLEVRPDVVARLVDVWNAGHEAGRSPSEFSGPVLIVRGASDPFVTEEMAVRIRGRFGHARLLTVPEAGHWAHVEQPAEVAGLVREFVEQVGLVGAGSAASTADWRSAFSQKTRAAFGQALAADVVLEGVTLIKPVCGRKKVQRVMETASKIYSSLKFTDQASAGKKQYVEWVAEAHNGVKFDGVTILTRDEDGAIAHVAIHHRPMEAAMFFSREMGRSLEEELGPGYFLEDDDAHGEVA